MLDNENFYYGLSYDPIIGCIIMTLRGYFNSHYFRTVTEELLRLIVHYNTKKVLADTTDMHLISHEDQKWLTQEFLPRAIQQGYQVCAMVNSKYYFTRISTQSIAEKMNDAVFNLQFFEDKNSAVEWLKNYEFQS